MATVTTSVEARRGCGWRAGGGIYLVSDGIGVECDALPIELTVCPICGCGFKPSRSLAWVTPDALLEGHVGFHGGDEHALFCPLGAPGRLGERAGLLWIGEMFYTPAEWLAEGRRMGFSRRLRGVPRGFVVGETWVLTAHRKGKHVGYRPVGQPDAAVRELVVGDTDELEHVYVPAIFHVWRPDRIEYVVKGDESEEELDRLEQRGLTLVRVVRAEQEVMT